LLFTFIGGVGFFFGPMIGAIVGVFLTVLLSEFTRAWQLYIGAFFILIVRYAQFGLAGIIMLNMLMLKYGQYSRIRVSLAKTCAAALVALTGLFAFVEMLYHHTLDSANGTVTHVYGISVDTAEPGGWIAALLVLTVGGVLFYRARRRFA